MSISTDMLLGTEHLLELDEPSRFEQEIAIASGRHAGRVATGARGARNRLIPVVCFVPCPSCGLACNQTWAVPSRETIVRVRPQKYSRTMSYFRRHNGPHHDREAHLW